MAHYFDVISCGIKQMQAKFSLPFGLHTRGVRGWGCAAGTLEPLAYTRAHSSELCCPMRICIHCWKWYQESFHQNRLL